MTCSRLLAAFALLLPAWALAQAPDASTTTSSDKEGPVAEIERGVFVGIAVGPSFILNPPAPSDAKRPLSSGQTAEVELGVDLGDRLSIAALIAGTSNRAGADYVAFSGGTASGDFSSLMLGGSARLALVGLKDSEDTERTWLYLRAGGGYTLFAPRELLITPDVRVFAGVGVDYFTRLRHFSIGAELTGSFLVGTRTIGFAVTPNLRYAF